MVTSQKIAILMIGENTKEKYRDVLLSRARHDCFLHALNIYNDITRITSRRGSLKIKSQL
jgi:hypothetical protein